MGVVGEENNIIIQTLSACNKMSFGIRSASGSGKSMLVDSLMALLPERDVYDMGMASNTAHMYSAKEINKKKLIYVPELQKAMNNNNPIVIEILKNITEGKSVDRKVYNLMENRTKKQKIKGDLGVIFTLAIENKFKTDEEFDRRVISLPTDLTEEMNRKVVRRIGKSRFNKKRLKIMSDDEMEDIRFHIEKVLNLQNLDFENPFAEYIAGIVPVPFVKVRTFIKHYYDLIEASTRFHFEDRYSEKSNNHLKLFVSLADVYYIHKIYGQLFNQTIHHLPMLGTKIMRLFDDKNIGYVKNKDQIQKSLFQTIDDETKRTYLTVNDIHRKLKEKHMLLKHQVIKDECELLIEAGFLGMEKSGSKILFYKTDEIAEFEGQFDFKKCWEAGIENMKKNYPEKLNSWIKSQLNKDGKIELEHPITGKIILLEDLKIDKTLNEQIEEMDENEVESLPSFEKLSENMDELDDRYIKIIENTSSDGYKTEDFKNKFGKEVLDKLLEQDLIKESDGNLFIIPKNEVECNGCGGFFDKEEVNKLGECVLCQEKEN